jgi:hypothetical protein
VVRVTGQHLVLLLWTLWLVVALVSVGGTAGLILLLVVGGLGLGLVPTGLMDWRAYLITALAVHVLAAASRAFAQLTAVQPPAPARNRLPLAITAAVQPGPHAPAAAGPRHRSLPALPASVLRWPVQVVVGSVSLAGVIWLLILRPTVPWMYRADIPIMIGTVALLVAAEYGCWRFYKHLDRRLTEAMKQLQEDRQQRQDSDTRNHERSEWLEKRLQLAESEVSQRRGELSQAQSDFRRGQDVLRRTQDRLSHAQEELRHMQAELRQAQDELRRSHTDLHQAQSDLRLAHGDLRQAQGQDSPAPDEPPPAPDEPPRAQDASQPPQGDEGSQDDGVDALVWYRATTGVRAEPDQVAGPGPARVEMIRIVRLTPGPVRPGSQPGRSGIAIERGTLTITPEPGETVRHLTSRAEERLGRQVEAATAHSTAQAIGDPVWKTVSQRWVADGSAGFDTAAATVADFDADLHNILLNRPVQQFSSWAGVPGPAAAVLGGVAGAADLPVDRPLGAVTRIIQVGGIVVGMASGHAILASACLKSLVHDTFIEGLTRGIETTLTKRGVTREAAADRAVAGLADRLAAERTATERAGQERGPAERTADERAAAGREAAERAIADRAAALRRAAADRAAAARRSAADRAAAEERAAADQAKRAAEEHPATRPNREPRGPGFSPFG